MFALWVASFFLEELVNIFLNYVKDFDLNDEKIMSKYNHSLRVEVLCEMIAKNLKLSKREIELAKLCGLYHDIGRFFQAQKYNTFCDLRSIDHGDKGLEIFNEEIVPKLNISKNDVKIIEKCIKYHNKYSYEGLNNDELLFVKIIRDADKVDILYQYAFVKMDIIIDPNLSISDECKNCFNDKKTIQKSQVTNSNEKIMIILALIWDINYDYSFVLIKNNKYYDKIKQKINSNIYDEYFLQIDKILKEKTWK